MNGCKNNVTGGGGGGKKITIKDNFEAPQTNSQIAKDFLTKYKEYYEKYSKAELMSYTVKQGVIYSSGYARYYFDENANLTNIYWDYSGDEKLNYKFWGMLPQDTKMALYYREVNGSFELYHKVLVYEKGLIKSKSFYSDDDLMKNMLLALFNETTQIKYDTSKINPIQTNTKDANDWKKEVTNKTIKWGYAFDSDGNLTVDNDRKYNFWGATNDGKLYGLYYDYNGTFYMDMNIYVYVNTSVIPIYSGRPPFIDVKYKTNYTTNIFNGGYKEAEKLIFPIKTNYIYDYGNLKTSTTTTENETYSNNVRNKIIEQKDVMNTYTFLPNGDINAQAANGKNYTLHFWGAKDSTNGIYYAKINLKDIFGNTAPNLETYFYYGYRFDETTYKNRPILREYWQPYSYHNSFTNWYEKYFYKNGNPKNNDIDWASMPLQTTNIYWISDIQDEILLREK